ncbi:MAG TPA: DUF6542 domain-containing protein [Jiangellales bacterium]|nr:DUF6542 domain-containing protein [Jiangellales bacterium]
MEVARTVGAWLATVRLTAAGTRVLGIGAALLLATLDSGVSPGLGPFFVVTATALCGWLSARARREALFTAAVLPPLVFLAASMLAAALGRGIDPDSGWFVASVQTLAATAPGLYVATAVGTGLALVRRQLAGPRHSAGLVPQDEADWAARRSRRSSWGSEKISVSSAERTSSTRG